MAMICSAGASFEGSTGGSAADFAGGSAGDSTISLEGSAGDSCNGDGGIIGAGSTASEDGRGSFSFSQTIVLCQPQYHVIAI